MKSDRRSVVAGMAGMGLLSAVDVRAATGQAAIDVTQLGADPTGGADSTGAFQAAALAVEKSGGGEIVIPPGDYRVGRQRFAGAAGRGYAYLGEDILSISHCPRPVVIQAGGARLTLAGGMRYGSFDPVYGKAFLPEQMPFTEPDAKATLGNFLNFEDNASVVIEGPLTLDGAIGQQIIGGAWGDTGRQLAATGVRAYNNRAFHLRGLHSRNQGLDHVMIGWTGLTTEHEIYPHRLEDVYGVDCGRNGFSWVGGNSLTCTDCHFERCGKAAGVSSAPRAGVDLEAEVSICRGGVFERLKSIDNAGLAVGADSGDIADCEFRDCLLIGTSNWSAWMRKPRLRFLRCAFIGAMVHTYGDPDRPDDGARFIDCINSLNPRHSPTGKICPWVSDFSAAYGALWQGGYLDLYRQPHFHSVGGPQGMRWRDTRISGVSSGPLYAGGVFEGEVVIDYPNGPWEGKGQAVVKGTVKVREKPVGASAPRTLTLHSP
jgi:hypothetical protein